MPEVIPFVLWSWIPATLLLFWKLPPARAAAIALVGGWLVLPTARFADEVANVAFPYWIMPACLPSGDWTTKARVVGVSLVLGVSAFDPRAWSRFRPTWFDLPMLGWCLVPLASGLAAGVPAVEASANLAYQMLAWGVPYLVGRLYFADPTGMTVLARTIVGGGVASVPFCLVENLAGPCFYRLLYGFHPYQLDGARRYLGYRPIVLMEHGNQLGAWMASTALVAAWLWRSKLLPKFWGMPGPFVVSLLATTSVLTQSAGAVGLLVVGLASLEATWRVDRRWPLALALVVPLIFLGARAANLFDAKGLAMSTGLGRGLAGASIKLDRQSLGWRLRVEERAAKVALATPLAGLVAVGLVAGGINRGTPLGLCSAWSRG